MRIRILLLLLCGLISICSMAQFKKGMRMAGSSIGSAVYNSGEADITVAQIGSNTSDVKNYNVSITPILGWFINDNTALGISVNVNPQGSTISYEQSGSTYQKDKSNTFNFGVGGFIRNYFKSGGSWLPFGHLGINAGISTVKTEGFFYGGSGPLAYKDTYNGDSNGGFFSNATLQAGITKMVSQLTGLDIYLGYNFSYSKSTFKRTTLRDLGNNGTVDQTLENETTTKFTNHGFLVGVGFQIFLDRN